MRPASHFAAFCLLVATPAGAHDIDVLVFTKTAGFAHSSIPTGVTAIQQLGAEHHFNVTVTSDATTCVAALPAHDVVVFLNTTGDVFDAAQETAFKAWYQSGGGYVGIHAASDTEHGWPWYLDMVGAQFSGHPAIQSAKIKFLDRVHPITDVIDSATSARVESWTYSDEWYNFTATPREKVHVLAVLDESSYSGGTHGNDHPIAWCREFDGGRSAYLGMGHTEASYAQPIFRGLITNAIEWAGSETDGDSGATIGGNYEKIVLVANPAQPMALDVASNGDVYWAERTGAIKRHRQTTGFTSTVGTVDAYSGGEFGVVAFTLDPAFDPALPATRHFYLMYAPNPAAATMTRVSRFSLDGAGSMDPASEKVLLEFPCNRPSNHGGAGHHQGGTLRFDPAGNLFVSVGDNTDASNYSPRNTADIMKDARKSAANSNDLRGGILRIRPDIGNGPAAHPNYTIPAGNLFPEGTPGTRPEVYTKGARNPFRMCVDPHTGWLYYGDVGPDGGTEGSGAFQGPRGHDEFNQVRGPGWFGWPYFIADNKPYLDGSAVPWTVSSLRADLAPYFTTPSFLSGGASAGDSVQIGNPQPAWIWYGADLTPAQFSEMLPSGGRTAMAGAVYQHAPGKNFPAYHDKTLFLMEWSRNLILEVKTNASGGVHEITRFAPNIPLSRPMDMVFGADGAMYLIEWGASFGSGTSADTRISKIQYTLSNKSPVAMIGADRRSGGVPLTVNFSSAGSLDPGDAGAVNFAWDFDGDGNTDSTAANPSHVYATAGTYQALLTVTDSEGLSAHASLTISAGNHAPVVAFLNPPHRGFFDWGDSVDFQVTAEDEEDGSTADGSIQATDVLFEASLGHADHQHNEVQENLLVGSITIPRDESHAFGEDLSYVLDASYADQGAPGVEPVTGAAKVVLNSKILMARNCDGHSGLAFTSGADPVGGAIEASSIDHGDHLVFRDLDLTGIMEIGARSIAPGQGGIIAIRMDALNGPVLGTIAVPGTGAAYRDFRTTITDPGGRHDLYFVFTNAASPTNLMRLNWLNFRGPGIASHRAGPAVIALEVAGATRQQVRFDQAVDRDSAASLARYAIDGGASVSAVEVAADQRSVILSLANTSPGHYYHLEVDGVLDLAGDPMNSPARALLCAPLSEPMGFAYGVNCGAPTAAGLYIDPQGRVYYPDPYSAAGTSINSTTSAIANTSDDILYQSERWSGSAFTYQVAVPRSGDYTVTVKLAEIYFTTANSRRFNVAVEGVTLATNLDLVAQAGAKTAYDITTTVPVTDGSLTITVSPGSVENPKLSAFYVESAGFSNNTPRGWYGVKANSSTAYTSVADGTPYRADGFWTAPGNWTTTTTGSITGANGDDALYLTERWSDGNLTYNIPVCNGTYEAVLHYAEIWEGAQSPGVRKFNAYLEGGLLAPAPLDLAQVVGYRTAYRQTATVAVSDGTLTVHLEQIPGFNNPKIAAIQLRGTADGLPDIPPGIMTWLASHPAQGLDPAADPDGDGLDGYLEYALGGDPSVPEAGLLPRLDPAAADHDLLFSRPAGLPDVAYRMLASDDLTDWTEILPEQELTAQGGGREQVRYRNLRAAAGNAGIVEQQQLFYRLAVDLVPASP